MAGFALGLASLAVAATNGLWFVGRMRRVAVPQNRIAHEALWALALALAVATFWQGAGVIGGVAAGLGGAASLLMLLLRLGGPQARNTPAVAVGGAILDFTAPDENGVPFRLSSLAGKPILLKFFRGHW
jgi:hypothetical protein